jgi:hypothetical protein
MRYRTSRIPGTGPLGPREVILSAYESADLRVGRDGYVRAGDGGAALDRELRAAGVVLRPVFHEREHAKLREHAGTCVPGSPCTAPDLSTYYRVVPSSQTHEMPDDATALNAQLRRHEAVAAAYVQPSMVLTVLPTTVTRVPELPDAEPSGPTPDFSGRQGYLEATSAGGIDARYAWSLMGGHGDGVRVVDVEQAWCLTHEDLGLAGDDLMGGIPPADGEARNHGSAVIGMLAGAHNRSGIMGICPAADVKAVSIFGPPGWTVAVAIRNVADRLSPGDVMLIEQMGPGPNRPRRPRADDQAGWIAVEWWPLWLDAIQYAVSRGVIVVEAAGNGSEDLDAPDYERGSPAFGRDWRNPLRRGGRDSGAIIVGAGAPPPGTHGEYGHGPDRSRMPFSNWGGRVDVQGWGREVTTCGGRGNGPDALFPIRDENRWYTDDFSGTSSATPMVAGALACVQGILQAAGRERLTPTQARDALRDTGAAQVSAPGRPASQNIGRRPDVRALVEWAFNNASPAGGAKPRPRRRVVKQQFLMTLEDGRLSVESVESVDGDLSKASAPDATQGAGWKGPSMKYETPGGNEVEVSWDELGGRILKALRD